MFSRGLIFPAIALTILVIALPSFADEKPSKNKAQSELQRIQEQLQGVKKKEKAAAKKERSVLDDLQAIDQSLNQKRAEVKRLETRLSGVSSEIDRTNSEMQEYQAKLKHKEGDLAARLRSMYKTQRAGGLWVLLVSGDYGSMLKRYKYLAILSERDRKIMDDYQGDLNDLSRYTAKLKGQKEDYDKTKNARDAEAARVAAQEEDKKKLLAQVRQQRTSYQAMAKDLEEQSRRMKDLITRLEVEKKAQEKKERERRAQEKKLQEKKIYAKPLTPLLPKLPVPSGHLDWPVAGKIVSYFGKQLIPQYNTYIYKNGIEIQAPLGANVHAVEGAEVAFANWFKGLGLVAILRHGGDLYSVYAHLANLKVKVGDRVSRGQVIATVGDTGAPSGPTLYFELRKGSEAQDPLKWLKRR